MSDEDEAWGPWIDHNGGCVPLQSHFLVEVQASCDCREKKTGRVGLVGSFNRENWIYDPNLTDPPIFDFIRFGMCPARIRKYRKKKPEGMKKLDRIMAKVWTKDPEPIDG